MVEPDMPISTDAQLDVASPELINRQIAWQVNEIIDPAFNQEQLGHVIGRDQTFISKVIHERASLTAAHAAKIDDALGTPTDGWPFVALVEERNRRATEQKRSSRLRPKIFLAAAMSQPKTTYEESRAGAMDLAQAIELYCKRDVYFAGRDIHTESDFDPADLGYQSNYDHIRTSTHFVLLWEGMPVEPGKTVSSIWVEAGIALALGIPSTYFVPDLASLPYILQQATSIPHPGTTPKIAVRLATDATVAVNLVKKSAAWLFP